MFRNVECQSFSFYLALVPFIPCRLLRLLYIGIPDNSTRMECYKQNKINPRPLHCKTRSVTGACVKLVMRGNLNPIHHQAFHHLANPARMSAALVRVLLLVIATALQALSIVPPNPTPDDAHQERFRKPTGAPTSPGNDTRGISREFRPDGWTRSKKQKMRSRLGSFYFPYAFVTSFCILVMLEAPRSFSHEDPLNFRLVSGTLLTALASLLRLSSFRSLGHHFTYQLAILPSHTLVTTGPYAYIRHPSYVALPFIISGCALSFTSQGTVLRGWIGESNTDWVVLSVLIGMLHVGWKFVKRAEVEDRVLKEEFGKEWEEWARAVKYRFIPGLY